MVDERYSTAITEVLHYLNGICQEDLDKIPNKLMIWLKENASKEYVCNFDYNKPLKELNLLEEAKGIIGMICLNYWCDSEEQKTLFVNRLNENEKAYQKELREKYSVDDIFRKNNSADNTDQVAMVEVRHDKWYERFFPFFRKVFRRK